MDKYLLDPVSDGASKSAYAQLGQLVARWRLTAKGLAVRDALIDLGATPSEVEWILATTGSDIGILIGLPSQIPDPRRFAQIRLQAWRLTYRSDVASQ